GSDRLLVQAQLGADLRGAPRVVDEVLAGASLLALVFLGREIEGPREQVLVDVRVVGSDVRDQLVDELLVPSTCFEDRHGKSVLPGFRVPVTSSIGCRSWYPKAEGTMSVNKRRRERK